jgi:hypothetical protein
MRQEAVAKLELENVVRNQGKVGDHDHERDEVQEQLEVVRIRMVDEKLILGESGLN